MIPQIATKVLQVTNPVSITAAATTASVDTKGWRHCRFIVNLGAVGAAAAVFQVQESNDDGSTDAYAPISGLVSSGSSGATRLPQTTDANTISVIDISLLGRDRYLDFQFTAGGSATLIAVTAILSRGEAGPDTDAEKGATGLYFALPA